MRQSSKERAARQRLVLLRLMREANLDYTGLRTRIKQVAPNPHSLCCAVSSLFSGRKPIGAGSIEVLSKVLHLNPDELRKGLLDDTTSIGNRANQA